MTNLRIKPFGDNAAEKERNLEELYLEAVHFSQDALDPHVSIIVGRRGSGKTALARFFRFESESPYDVYVDIDQPEVFTSFLSTISGFGPDEPHVFEALSKTWEIAFWNSLMAQSIRQAASDKELKKCRSHINKISNNRRITKSSSIVRATLTFLAGFAGPHARNALELTKSIEEAFDTVSFEDAKDELLAFLDGGKQAVVVLDTLEQYEIRKQHIQYAIGAMLQAVSRFSLGEVHENIHIKCFLPSEIFQHIDHAIPNVAKILESPLYLHWTPKDLLRLSCLRLAHFFDETGNTYSGVDFSSVDWGDYKSVREKVWDRYFPHTVTNGLGIAEDSLQYIVRHTQLRPRQVIWILNNICQIAHADGRFPNQISNQDIVKGVRNIERKLADEIFNSYAQVYPDAKKIVSVFRQLPPILEKAQLDQYAARSKNHWDMLEYDRYTFRRLVTEVGLLGAVVDRTEKFVETEFEYNTEGTLNLSDDESCAFHPVFYDYLRIKTSTRQIVYPLAAEQFEDI